MRASLLRGLLWLFSWIPERLALCLGRGAGWVYGHVIRYHRVDALDTAKTIRPDGSLEQHTACVNSMYTNLGMCLVESMRAIRLGKAFYRQRVSLSEDARARFEEVLSQGKGCLVVTAHLGNWEMLSAVYYHLDVMCSIITKEMKSPVLNEVLNGIRRRSGGHVLPRNNAYRPSLRALRKNEIVAFVLDQNMIRDEGVFVDFLGKPACTTPGLAHMSASTGVPVLPVFVVRERPGWYRLDVGEAIPAPAGRSEEELQRATQMYTERIEQRVREHPDQWILIHRRWRTVPQPLDSGDEKKVDE